MSEFQPRPGQQDVLDYTGGKLGISAVPGSGKTRTLAELAARLVSEAIDSDQEVLVVTLVNSAVDNFRRRINEAIKRRGLLPNFGYRVRTLHGLAHDIVRERPGLVGLSEDFRIIDEREARAVREEAVEAWLHGHPEVNEAYLAPELEGDRAAWVARNRWPELVRVVVAAFIKRAKDRQLVPSILEARLSELPDASPFQLARMGVDVYADYQRSLTYRGGVDFDDLIRLALEALTLDPDYLARLRRRWPYILEDEAQDSTELQESILRLLVGERGNWVRVGDPNQAIYHTFTTADPEFLRSYLRELGVDRAELSQSGRSQLAIIDLANFLVDWAYNEHPTEAAREAFTPQHIEPTSPGDPQPNPPLEPKSVQLVDREFTPGQELQAVADSLERWLSDHVDRTVAVLSPRNQRGIELARLLEQKQIKYVELLQSSTETRRTAGSIGNLLHCLADPTSPRKLSMAFRVWRRHDRGEPEAEALVGRLAKLIRACSEVETYLWPRADRDWLAAISSELSGEEIRLLHEFREVARRWHLAASLPIDQLILTLANDIFQKPTELALVHKLALLLRDVARSHPSYRLAELVEELAVIARNERRFLGVSSEDTAFEPSPGVVTVATIHKAKGLEWDRVYLMSVNNYDFPSGLAHDTYQSESWFVRDGLNLQAEALAQLQALASTEPGSPGSPGVEEGAGTTQARLDYIRERLRLLYVGITRAERDLVITWNTGRRTSQKLQPAVPFVALHESLQRARRAPDAEN